jgi:hypothetical protein
VEEADSILPDDGYDECMDESLEEGKYVYMNVMIGLKVILSLKIEGAVLGLFSACAAG